jgi:hypothetical protein
MRWTVVAAIAVLIGAGSAAAQPPPPPNYAPIPPPRREVVPPLPGRTVIWQPGHWHWDGYRYIWINGRYVERRPQYGRYVEGHWVWAPKAGGWVWRPAHWQ